MSFSHWFSITTLLSKVLSGKYFRRRDEYTQFVRYKILQLTNYPKRISPFVVTASNVVYILYMVYKSGRQQQMDT